MKVSEEQLDAAVLSYHNEMANVVHNFNWENTLLGNPDTWTDTLKVLVNTCLHSRSPTMLLWGHELIQIYNDAFRMFIGDDHRHAIGSRAEDSWLNTSAEAGPLLRRVIKEGNSFLLEDRPLSTKGSEEAATRFLLFLTARLSPLPTMSAACG